MPQEVVDLRGSVGRSGGTDINVCCEDKLRSLSGGEIQNVVEVSEESMANILGVTIVSERVVDEPIRVDAVDNFEEGGQE